MNDCRREEMNVYLTLKISISYWSIVFPFKKAFMNCSMFFRYVPKLKISIWGYKDSDYFYE